MPLRAALLVTALISLWGCAQARDNLEVKLGEFEHQTPAGIPIRVWTAAPQDVTPDTQVVIVMHGMSRDAERYRDDWVSSAERLGMIVAVPEFDAERFPGSRGYNLGNRVDDAGQPLRTAAWSFAAIESLFDDIKQRTGTRRAQYALYGHSAGAQFVHRFLYYVPRARVSLAVAANAGWYTMPDDTAFPYGLRDADVSQRALSNALRTPLLILLGEDDNDPNHRSLRRTPEAMQQGAHRLARGHAFYASGRAAAKRAGVELAWRLQTVPNVAHSNRGMAGTAASILAAEE